MRCHSAAGDELGTLELTMAESDVDAAIDAVRALLEGGGQSGEASIPGLSAPVALRATGHPGRVAAELPEHGELVGLPRLRAACATVPLRLTGVAAGGRRVLLERASVEGSLCSVKAFADMLAALYEKPGSAADAELAFAGWYEDGAYDGPSILVRANGLAPHPPAFPGEGRRVFGPIALAVFGAAVAGALEPLTELRVELAACDLPSLSYAAFELLEQAEHANGGIDGRWAIVLDAGDGASLRVACPSDSREHGVGGVVPA